MQYEFQGILELALHRSPRGLVKRIPAQCLGRCCRLESCSEAKHFFFTLQLNRFKLS